MGSIRLQLQLSAVKASAPIMTSILRNTAAMARENGGEGKNSRAVGQQRKALGVIRSNNVPGPRENGKTLGMKKPLPEPRNQNILLDDDDDVEMETPEKEKVQVVEEEDPGVGQVPAEVTDIDVVEDQCNPQQPGASLATVWSPTLQYYSTYRAEDILPVVASLAAVLVRRGQTKLRAVHTKYTSRKFMKVADMAELDGELVGRLARMELTEL